MSLSKIVTAVATVQLHERGNLNIHDEVRTHLPCFEVQYPSDDSEKITIRHLLNHSSGLADLQGVFSSYHFEDETTPSQAAFVKKVLADDSTLKYEPGSDGTWFWARSLSQSQDHPLEIAWSKISFDFLG